MQIAQTILEQLGGNRFITMTGAKDFVSLGEGHDSDGAYLGGLMFRIGRGAKNKANKVCVKLSENDTYRVYFFNLRGVNCKACGEVIRGVYAERVARLNPAAGEIGPGMLASLVEQARGVRGRNVLYRGRRRVGRAQGRSQTFYPHGSRRLRGRAPRPRAGMLGALSFRPIRLEGPVMTTATRKNIEAALKREIPELTEFELIRAREGYFYAAGRFRSGEPFVTSGIYVFALCHLSLASWIEDLGERIRAEM